MCVCVWKGRGNHLNCFGSCHQCNVRVSWAVRQDTSTPAKVKWKGGTFVKYYCLFPHSDKSFVFCLTFSNFCLFCKILLSFIEIAKWIHILTKMLFPFHLTFENFLQQLSLFGKWQLTITGSLPSFPFLFPFCLLLVLMRGRCLVGGSSFCLRCESIKVPYYLMIVFLNSGW
jgi:hypothetical protein